MTTKRGDVVVVAASGDYGKPRPAVVVQSDFLPDDLGSIVVCQLTSELAEARSFRVTIDPTAENGLRVRSQIMVDKPVTLLRGKIGQVIGRLTDDELDRLGAGLAFVLGLAD